MTDGKVTFWKTAIIIVGFPIAYMIYGASDYTQGLLGQEGRDSYIQFWAGIIALHWLSVIAVAIALHTSGRKFFDLGLKMSHRGLLTFILIYMVTALVALGLVEYLVGSINIPDSQFHKLSLLIPTTFEQRIFFVLLVFTTGFCEEIVYRGFAITGLTDAGLNRWLAVAIAAFIFVGIHGFNAYSNRFIFLFGGGLMFGAVFLTTRNLLPPIIIHLAINLSAMFAVFHAAD